MSEVPVAKMYHQAVETTGDLRDEDEMSDERENTRPDDEPMSSVNQTMPSDYQSMISDDEIETVDLAQLAREQHQKRELEAMHMDAELIAQMQIPFWDAAHKLASFKAITIQILAEKKVLADLVAEDLLRVVAKGKPVYEQQQEAQVKRIQTLDRLFHHVLFHSFNFLKLPIEIRHMIYKYLFQRYPRKVHAINRYTLWKAPDINDPNKTTPFISIDAAGNTIMPEAKPPNPAAILMTCKKIYAEAGPLFMRHTPFSIGTCYTIPQVMVENRLVFTHMRSIYVKWHGMHAAQVFSLLNQCMGLEELEIEVNDETVNGKNDGKLNDLRAELGRSTWKRKCLTDTVGCNELCLMSGLKKVSLVINTEYMPTVERAEFRVFERFLKRTVTGPRIVDELRTIKQHGERESKKDGG